MTIYEFIFKVYRRAYNFLMRPVYKVSFRSFGQGASVFKPSLLQGLKYISIGKNVYVQEGAWLLALVNSEIEPTFSIEDDVYVGRYCHFVATKDLCIGKNVLIADKVYISDNAHDYRSIDMPVKNQPIVDLSPVSIGEGSWIGENVCVIGVSIGRNCVIAANSVVTRDVPYYSIVAGAPARVIKMFNHSTKCWEKV